MKILLQKLILKMKQIPKIIWKCKNSHRRFKLLIKAKAKQWERKIKKIFLIIL